jgi:hypothetical protein
MGIACSWVVGVEYCFIFYMFKTHVGFPLVGVEVLQNVFPF